VALNGGPQELHDFSSKIRVSINAAFVNGLGTRDLAGPVPKARHPAASNEARGPCRRPPGPRERSSRRGEQSPGPWPSLSVADEAEAVAKRVLANVWRRALNRGQCVVARDPSAHDRGRRLGPGDLADFLHLPLRFGGRNSYPCSPLSRATTISLLRRECSQRCATRVL